MPPRLARLKVYLALSRTPHGLLDLAGPFCAAVLAGGSLPGPGVVALGLVTVFAGYTAVYALNDIVDYRSDKKRLEESGGEPGEGYLDAIFIRHPLAGGHMGFWSAVAWFLGWTAVAFAGAWLLNPVCAFLLILGCLLETAYCLLLRVSHLRALLNGVVKSLGPLAAVFAVDKAPSAGFVALVFAWVFLWEIGGQNIPADWRDAERDKALGARTVPVVLGYGLASRLALACLAGSLVLAAPLLAISPLAVSAPVWLTATAASTWLLLPPAARLVRTLARPDASALFNRASLYPALVLASLLVFLALRAAA